MALTDVQMAIVKSTAPVLKEHGNTITACFYKSLLGTHPELKNIFSLRNQQTGAQQAALANSVLAYATYIDDLPKLTHAVERIAHKHASLFVKPEQYPIVGHHLMQAIAEVLGPALTPEIADAWTAAYGQLADLFIQKEQALYDASGAPPQWRRFKIVRKEKESESVTSFYLEPSDGVTPLPKYLPGQYLSVQIPIPELDNLNQSRQYSLSEAQPADRSHYRVSVKREATDPDATPEDIGAGKVPGLVSNRLHDDFNVGDELELSHPQGEFCVDVTDASKATAPLVMLSAGVGATPLLSILESVLGAGSSMADRPVSWIQASSSSRHACFAARIRQLAHEKDNISTKLFLDQVGEGDVKGETHDFASPLDLSALDAAKDLYTGDGGAEYFVCGPIGWMLSVRSELEGMGVSRERMHLELFGTGDVPQ